MALHQRAWRLLNEALPLLPAPNGKSAGRLLRSAQALRARPQGLNAVAEEIEGSRSNRAIAAARICEALTAALQDKAARRMILIGVACAKPRLLRSHDEPFMPHLAEEAGRCSATTCCLETKPGRRLSGSLLIDDTVTIAVQVKAVAATKSLSSQCGSSAFGSGGVRLESVTRAVDGRPIKKVIVVPERIVNVVA